MTDESGIREPARAGSDPLATGGDPLATGGDPGRAAVGSPGPGRPDPEAAAPSRSAPRSSAPGARRGVRVILPHHLRSLAGTGAEVAVEVDEPVTIAAVLDALEARHPALRGTIRDHGTGARRAFIRYFALGEDLSHEPPDTVLPGPVVEGAEPFRILGAIAGG